MLHSPTVIDDVPVSSYPLRAAPFVLHQDLGLALRNGESSDSACSIPAHRIASFPQRCSFDMHSNDPQ